MLPELGLEGLAIDKVHGNAGLLPLMPRFRDPVTAKTASGFGANTRND